MKSSTLYRNRKQNHIFSKNLHTQMPCISPRLVNEFLVIVKCKRRTFIIVRHIFVAAEQHALFSQDILSISNQMIEVCMHLYWGKLNSAQKN